MPDPYDRIMDLAVSNAELAGVVQRIDDRLASVEKDREAEKRERADMAREQRRRTADRFDHRWDWAGDIWKYALGAIGGGTFAGIAHWFVKSVLRLPVP